MHFSKKISKIPFDPSRFPFFYGWIILIVGTLGVTMSMPGQTNGVSLFTEHLIKALKISRVQLSSAYLLGTVSSSLLLIQAGKWYDRYGARPMATIAGLGLAGGLAAISQSDRMAEKLCQIPPFTNPVVVAFCIVASCFLIMRFFGQGMLTMVSRNMLMKWFDRRRGFANGLSGIFVSLSFSGAPWFFSRLISAADWRGAWLISAGALSLLFVPLVLLTFRDKPEDCGLVPDGKWGGNTARHEQKIVSRKQYTLPEARKRLIFWVFTVGLSLHALYMTGLAFHVVSIFEKAGMSTSRAVSIFLPTCVIAVVVNLVAGYISDYIRLKYLLAIQMSALLIGLLGFAFLRPGLPIWMLIVGNGIETGLFSLLSTVALPRFFGCEHLGAINGLNYTMMVFFSAAGPWTVSQSLAQTGSYACSAYLFGAIAILILVLIGLTKNPQRDSPVH